MSSRSLSVIVPLYQQLRWLREALSSVQRDGFEDWEALLVDDGSPVDPHPAIAPFLNDGRFRYVATPHGGIAAARNMGLQQARGRWTAFLDQDDRSLPNRFQRQIAVGEAEGDRVAIVYSDYERIDEHGRVIDRYISRAVPHDRLVRACLSDRGPVALGTALCRTEWLRRVGGFDPELSGFDECDLFVRLALAGAVFGYLPGVVHQWRRHGDNTMRSPEFQAARLRFVAKLTRLAEADPRLRAVLRAFEARSWYAVGLDHAERGSWRDARRWCWKAWRRRPALGSALYLALKAWLADRR